MWVQEDRIGKHCYMKQHIWETLQNVYNPNGVTSGACAHWHRAHTKAVSQVIIARQTHAQSHTEGTSETQSYLNAPLSTLEVK